jgi:hypothetical protein
MSIVTRCQGWGEQFKLAILGWIKGAGQCSLLLVCQAALDELPDWAVYRPKKRSGILFLPKARDSSCIVTKIAKSSAIQIEIAQNIGCVNFCTA